MLFFVFVPYLAGMSTYDETVAACALNKLFGDHPKQIFSQVEAVRTMAARASRQVKCFLMAVGF